MNGAPKDPPEDFFADEWAIEPDAAARPANVVELGPRALASDAEKDVVVKFQDIVADEDLPRRQLLALGATPRAPAALAGGGGGEDGRLRLQYHPSRFAPQVAATIEELGKAGVYVSGPRLAMVARADQRQQARSAWTDSQGRTRFGVVAGSPQITALSAAVLKMRASEVVAFEKYVVSRGGWSPCAPPDDIIAAIHDLRSWNLPILRGIAETPMLRPDGTIASAEGYDELTGYWIAQAASSFPRVSERPTQEDAQRAFRELAECFEDFPYADPSHIAVPIAAIMTVLARAYIRGAVPGFVFDAGQGGTGKTLQTDAIATVAMGRAASRKAYPSSDEEMEKALAAYALRGSSLISIDDVKRPLGGENLDRVLTARADVEFRRLGKTELLTMPWIATLLFTGVNVSFLGQMARRVLVARIESKLVRPQDRTDFRHPELIEWIESERARLVTAALTILRSYIAHDSPDTGTARWGSFEEWSRLVPHAIKFAGGPDVLAARPADDDEDTSDATLLRALLDGLAKLCCDRAPHLGRAPSDGLTSGEIVEALFKSHTSEEHAELRAAVRDLTRHRAEAGPSASAVGTQFARYKGRALHVRGHVVRLVKVPDTHKSGADRWTVETIK